VHAGHVVRVAAFDLGTNTTRLLVAEGADGGSRSPRELDRRLLFTRLGQGVDASGRLHAAAIERTVAALRELRDVAAGLGAQRFRLGATSAVRDAANRDEFLDAAREVMGVDIDVLSGEDEARLSFLGATADLPPGRYVVSDIGGGSTEFVVGSAGSVEGRISIDIGSVRLTERHLSSDPPATAELAALEDGVDAALEAVDRAVPAIIRARFVGVAGTCTTLAAIHLGLEEYDPSLVHHFRLTKDDVDAQYRRLAGLTVAQRVEIPCLPRKRADVIVAGIAILSRSMARWSFADVVVSEKDILDGLARELLERS
jgi:exopolyphosphatase/guanosine-5'-triphosphate,3'-diphosphate pyrophosphatase